MLWLMEFLFLSFTLFCIGFNKILNYNPDPIFNVYQRPNGFYWIKVFLMFILLYIKQVIKRIKIALKNEEDLLKYHQALEKSLHPSAKQGLNTVYFNASNGNGDYLIVGMTIRSDKLVDGYLYVKINNENIGLLESIKLPDTSLNQTENCDGFNAAGLSIHCLEPMKMWRIRYQGKMKNKSNPQKTFDVYLEMTYTSNMPIINFDTELDPFTMAKCIALEKWNKEYFHLLKEHQQTYYEQYGNIRGHVMVDGEKFYLHMDSIRNHHFEKQRDRRNVHKYNLHMFSTANGDRFTVGEFCFPMTLSSFKMGFVYSASHKKVYPVTFNDFQLYQHGESGNPPSDYAFTIEAGRKTYTIKVDVIDSSHFYISKDWECKTIQRFCSFKVNSTKGWGFSECQQRNMYGRNISDSQQEHNIDAKNNNEEKNEKIKTYLCENCGNECNSGIKDSRNFLREERTQVTKNPSEDKSENREENGSSQINIQKFIYIENKPDLREIERRQNNFNQMTKQHLSTESGSELEPEHEPRKEPEKRKTNNLTQVKDQQYTSTWSSSSAINSVEIQLDEESEKEPEGRRQDNQIMVSEISRENGRPNSLPQTSNQYFICVPEAQQVNNDQYICEHCGRIYGSRIGLWSHLRTHNKPEPQPTNDEQHICEHCGRICGSRIGLWSHLRTHNKPEPQSTNDEQFICEHCGRICGSRIGLWSHLRTHNKPEPQSTNDEQFVCEHCGRICGSRIGLWSHLRTHNKPEPQSTNDEQFVCEHCGRICGSRIGLWSHLRTHNKPEVIQEKRVVQTRTVNRPRNNSQQYICEHCGRVCGSRIGLWSHLRVHNE